MPRLVPGGRRRRVARPAVPAGSECGPAPGSGGRGSGRRVGPVRRAQEQAPRRLRPMGKRNSRAGGCRIHLLPASVSGHPRQDQARGDVAGDIRWAGLCRVHPRSGLVVERSRCSRLPNPKPNPKSKPKSTREPEPAGTEAPETFETDRRAVTRRFAAGGLLATGCGVAGIAVAPGQDAAWISFLAAAAVAGAGGLAPLLGSRSPGSRRSCLGARVVDRHAVVRGVPARAVRWVAGVGVDFPADKPARELRRLFQPVDPRGDGDRGHLGWVRRARMPGFVATGHGRDGDVGQPLRHGCRRARERRADGGSRLAEWPAPKLIGRADRRFGRPARAPAVGRWISGHLRLPPGDPSRPRHASPYGQKPRGLRGF